MRIDVKVGALVAAVSALAVAVPASAHPGHSSHLDSSNQHLPNVDHPSQSHRCAPHNVAYVESGTIDGAIASTLAANSDGSWSGTLVVDVTSANHRAKSDKGTTVTYTFTNAKLTVRFDGKASGFAGGERVKLIGTVAAVGHNCSALTPIPAPVFRVAVVHPASS